MTPTAPPPRLSHASVRHRAASEAPCPLSRAEHLENEDLAALDPLGVAWRIDVSPPVKALAARLVCPRSHAMHAAFVAWLERLCSAEGIAALGEAARELASFRLAALRTRGCGTFDVVQEVARPLWPDLLAAWVGLPDHQRRRLHHLEPVLHALAEPSQLLPRRLAGLIAALDELRRMFAQAHRQPCYVRSLPNLFGILETGWTPNLGSIAEEAATAAVQLLMTGGRAAYELTGPAIDKLTSQPELVERLRAEPESTAAFVAEFQTTREPLLAARCGSRALGNDAFGSVSRVLAPMLATAVVDALVASRAPIARGAPGARKHVYRAQVAPLEHLVLRAGR